MTADDLTPLPPSQGQLNQGWGTLCPSAASASTSGGFRTALGTPCTLPTGAERSGDPGDKSKPRGQPVPEAGWVRGCGWQVPGRSAEGPPGTPPAWPALCLPVS